MSDKCVGCGTIQNLNTVILDWHASLMCDACVSKQDWSRWVFDPVQNVYSPA